MGGALKVWFVCENAVCEWLMAINIVHFRGSEDKVPALQPRFLQNSKPKLELGPSKSEKRLLDSSTGFSARPGLRMGLQTHAQARFKSDQKGFTLVELVVAIGVGILLLSVVVSFCSRTAGILQRLRIQREIRDSGLLAVESIEKSFRKALEYGGRITDISDTRISAKGPEYSVSFSFDQYKGEFELEVSKLEVTEGASGSESTHHAGIAAAMDKPGSMQTTLKAADVKEVSIDEITANVANAEEIQILEGTLSTQSTGKSQNTGVIFWPGGSLKCSNVKVKALVGDGYVDGSNPDALSARVVVIGFELGEDVYEISRPFKAAFAVYGGGGS